MQKILLFILSFFLFLQVNASNLVYPIQEMSKLNDRYTIFSKLNSSQKRVLPILDLKKWYDFYAKQHNWYNEYTRTYTMLWGATYAYWWDVWNGWHGWIDIATSEWTPVHAIDNWTVIFAWDKWAWWKLIAIKHNINWNNIYSSYAHLSKINVRVWEKIKSNQVIWEVWSTWNSTWNHIHFQIDSTSAPFHPYYSSSQTFKSLQWYTIDPIAFLNSNWAIIKTVIKKDEIVDKKDLLTRKDIEAREIKEFLKYHKLSLKYWDIWQSLSLNSKWKFVLKVTSRNWRKFNWSLPWGGLIFEYDSNAVKLLPKKLISVNWWYRDIIITPIKAWKTKITAKLWKTIIKKFYLNIYNPNKKIYATSWKILSSSSLVIWDLKTWAVVLKDNNNTNLININYGWTYRLYSNNNNIDFCVKRWTIKTISQALRKSCSYYSSYIDFDYNDTVLWILLYKYKIKRNTNTSLMLQNNFDNKLFTVKKVKARIPVWLTDKYLYKDDIIKTLENWISAIYRKWYFWENKFISELNSVIWIRNSLNYQKSKIKTKKYLDEINIRLKNLNNENKWRYSNLTRQDFLNLVWKYLIFKNINNVVIKTKYRDLDTYSNKIVNSFYTEENFWNDKKFWSYFKSKDKITRWEVAHILFNILKLK